MEIENKTHNICFICHCDILYQNDDAMESAVLEPCTDVASNLIAIDFQHAEYFTCDPLISQSIIIRFSNGFHCFSQDFISFPMIAHLTWCNKYSYLPSQVNHRM